jgi:hypothetical protein
LNEISREAPVCVEDSDDAHDGPGDVEGGDATPFEPDTGRSRRERCGAERAQSSTTWGRAIYEGRPKEREGEHGGGDHDETSWYFGEEQPSAKAATGDDERSAASNARDAAP